MILDHVHISRANSKLGPDIPSVSLPVGETCRKNAPCFKLCYGRHGRMAFPRVKGLSEKNYDIWKADPDFYKREIEIASFKSKFFRWHVCGDIPDPLYLEMMVEVAEKIPETKFLCFTKQYEIVNNYLDEHQVFPENLKMVLSAWGDWMPENPHNLPIAYIRLKDGGCNIPECAYQCSNYCGDCVMTGQSCWDLCLGGSVVFDQH